GGVLLLGACDADDEGDACVRQPDGKWKTIKTGVDLSDRGAGALADGRVAFLRNLADDDLPDDKLASAHGHGAQTKGRKPVVVAVDPSGKQQTLGALASLGQTSGELHVQSPIEEDAERALYFVLGDDEGAIAVAQAHGHDVQPPQRISGAAQARL